MASSLEQPTYLKFNLSAVSPLQQMDKWRHDEHPYEREYERDLRLLAAESDSKCEATVRSRDEERRIEALELRYRREQLRERDISRREKLRCEFGGRGSAEREVRRVRVVESLSPEPGLIISPESSPYRSDPEYRSRSHSAEREGAFWRRSSSPLQERRRRRNTRSKSSDRKSRRDGYHRSRRSEYRSYRRNSRTRSRSSSRSRSRGHKEHTPQPSEEPSLLILLTNLPPSADRGDIEVSTRQFQTREIRILFDTDTNKSRGIGLIEFAYKTDASAWLTQNKDSFHIFGEKITVQYTEHRAREGEWKCAKCNAFNYRHRLICFVCNTPLHESNEANQGSRPPELATPSNVLILRGLKFSTNEEGVRAALSTVSTHSVRDVRLIKDRLTKQSRGFCFIEFAGVTEATEALDGIFQQDPAFFVDGTRTVANFARGNFSFNRLSQAGQSAIEQGNWSSIGEAAPDTGVPVGEGGRPGEQEYSSKPVSYSAAPTGSTPETSSYVYDPSSGYYYDSRTGMYYDPNSQYHYDPVSQKYCYFDPATNAYVQVGAAAGETEESDPSKTKDKKKGELDNFSTTNTKHARKIAKDMERWAQKQNTAKSNKSTPAPAPQETEPVAGPPVLAGDFTLGPINISLDTRGVAEVGITSSSGQLDFSQLGSSLQSSSNPPVLSITAEPLYTDWERMACLLCKRQFQSRDQLVKHQQLSDLHRQNLEKTQY